MFQLYDDNAGENQFDWKYIGDVAGGRENLGEEMPVFVYRLFQYTIRDVISRRYGDEAVTEILRGAGELAGRELAKHLLPLELPFQEFIANLQEFLKNYKIGVLRVESFDMESGRAVLTVGEDLDCSGLPVVGRAVCNYDEGFLKGILDAYTKKNYVVTEVDCWATGSRVCRFQAHVEE